MLCTRLLLSISAILATSSAFSAPMAGLTTSGVIAYFDSESPQTLVFSTNVSGLVSGETLVGIDTRPATGELFGLGSQGRLYSISTSGVASTLTTTPAVLDGTAFGVDFNPTVDRFRIVSNNEQNLRMNPLTGGVAGLDAALTPAGDKVAVAYDRNFAGATVTTMFVIDSGTDTLAIQGGIDGNPSPNGGVITNIGALGFNTTNATGLDISATGVARALLTVGSVSGVYNVNLTTGAASLIGNSSIPLVDITFVPAIPAPIVTQLPSMNWLGLATLGSVLLLTGVVLTRRFS